MAIPNQNTPELDLRQIILDISASEGWALLANQVFVGGFQDDFYGNDYQIVIKAISSDMNPKWQFDNFTFVILVFGKNEMSKAEISNTSWAIHNALVGRDTTYLDASNRSYQQFNSVVSPYDGGSTPEARPLYVQRISVNRQILTDENNRQALQNTYSEI